MPSPNQQLLVHMDATERCRTRLDLACTLARQQGTALHALYAATSSMAVLGYSGIVTPDLVATLVALDTQRRDRARAIFDQTVQRAGITAGWGEVNEQPVLDAFARQALFADIVVLGQHEPSSSTSPEVPPDFVTSVLTASGKPCLVLPYAGQFASVGSRVVIAWKESREAARAVTAALPMLRLAQEVHVLTWAAAEPGIYGDALDLKGYLHLHGVAAKWHAQAAEPEQLGDLLLSQTYDLGADLLVMGCYGHSRAHEWMLGGVSRTVLQTMTLPVLMAH